MLNDVDQGNQIDIHIFEFLILFSGISPVDINVLVCLPEELHG